MLLSCPCEASGANMLALCSNPTPRTVSGGLNKGVLKKACVMTPGSVVSLSGCQTRRAELP